MLKPEDIIYDDKNEEYKILKPIGKGGMGYVLLVERISDKKQFAVKTLSVFIEGDGDYKALLNEGKLAEKITHKNVIKYEYFHNGEAFQNLPPYIIMDLAEESNLQDIINNHIKNGIFFEQDELLSFYFMLIDGMEVINSVLVHRDIKPSNILLKNGELKISDFGIAKIAGDPTRTKSFKGSGTLAFFPPEAFLNKENTVQMDIYSMGIVFYLLATLKHPYETEKDIENEDDWKNAHLYMLPGQPKDLNKPISPKVFKIIQKMIEKNPLKRFSSWNEIKLEMESIDKIKDGVYPDVIEKIIAKNLEKDTKIKQSELEATRKQEEKNQKQQMIIYQFLNDIIQPVEDFIKEYNSINSFSGDKMSILKNDKTSYPVKNDAYEIKTADFSNSLEINIHIVEDEDYYSSSTRDVFGDIYQQKNEPKISQNKILAWGVVETRNRQGFNLVLVKSDVSEYGEWFILENTHSGLAQRSDDRPDPFPFNLTEIRKEIHLIMAMHIYNTKVLPFDSKILIDFIADL